MPNVSTVSINLLGISRKMDRNKEITGKPWHERGSMLHTPPKPGVPPAPSISPIWSSNSSKPHPPTISKVEALKYTVLELLPPDPPACNIST